MDNHQVLPCGYVKHCETGNLCWVHQRQQNDTVLEKITSDIDRMKRNIAWLESSSPQTQNTVKKKEPKTFI